MKKIALLWLSALLGLNMAGCTVIKSVFQGATEAVTFEYDQAINFDQYAFSQGFVDGQNHEWYAARLRHSPKPGVWMMYVICSISNNESSAKDFQFDASNFYVVTNGNMEHHVQSLISNSTFKSEKGYFPVDSKPAEAFRTETLIGSEKILIPKGQLLTAPWRFLIYVEFDGPAIDRFTMNLPLQYKGHPVFMKSRNQPTQDLGGNDIKKENLPTQCRPASLS